MNPLVIGISDEAVGQQQMTRFAHEDAAVVDELPRVQEREVPVQMLYLAPTSRVRTIHDLENILPLDRVPLGVQRDIASAIMALIVKFLYRNLAPRGIINRSWIGASRAPTFVLSRRNAPGLCHLCINLVSA